MRFTRIQTLAALLVLSGGFAVVADPPLRAQEPPVAEHAFFGTENTTITLDGVAVTTEFTLQAHAAQGQSLAETAVTPGEAWLLNVPVSTAVKTITLVMVDPETQLTEEIAADLFAAIGTAWTDGETYPLEAGGLTEIRQLKFESGGEWTEGPPVVGVRGRGVLQSTPPVPTPEQAAARELGMQRANPDDADPNRTVVPIPPPTVEATVDSDREVPTLTAGCGTRTVDLVQGFNAVGWSTGGATPSGIAAVYLDKASPGLSYNNDTYYGTALADLPPMFLYDSGAQGFLRYDSRLPAALQGFDEVSAFAAFWINVPTQEGAQLRIGEEVSSRNARVVRLAPEWNFITYTGLALAPAEAFKGILTNLNAAFTWDAANGAYHRFDPQAPPIVNTMPRLAFGTAVWINVKQATVFSMAASDAPCGGAQSIPSFPDDAVVVAGADFETAAANDFVLFRNVEVLQGTNTSRVGEPHAGNDRNAILYTGNSAYAAASFDNGQTWSYADPDNLSPTPTRAGLACCDQLVWWDNDHQLLFWLIQYRRDSQNNNTIRIAVFESKSGLQADLQTMTPCMYDFNPQDQFGWANSHWFDFNQMRSSNDWLYVTSNLYQRTGSGTTATDTHQTGYVWRMELNDFAGCGSVSWQRYNNDTYYGTALAGEGSTTYWAVHDGSGNDSLHIGRARDSSTNIDLFTRSISAFPTSNQNGFICTAPDGTNPCARFNRRIMTGWVSNDQLGWMWHAAQGDRWAFPHTRVAIFRTSDLTLTSQPHVWNPNYAWVMPTVGVNSRGDIAGPIYKMGGGNHPKARAFIWDDISGTPTPWEVHSIRNGNDSPFDGAYGDYGGSVAYDNCRRTWLATVYTMQDGGNNSDAEHRMVWFGRERDGCPDLVIDTVAFALITGGEFLLIGEVTLNIGSGDAGASTTRYYLSRDQDKSSGDLLLDATHSVPALGPDISDPNLDFATIPERAVGAYYLLACADDTDVVSEITITNNCKASESQLTIEFNLGALGPIIVPFE